ncbi:MAG: DHH family phosphoesterase, partial [Anaerovoracaceae bacterium]|nr:DHH family phosphoesterase [Anaerovoracaceae bacterium]
MSDRKGRGMAEVLPFPACDIGTDGKITSASRRIGEVFLYDEIEGQDFFALTGFDFGQLAGLAKDGESAVVRRNDRSFSMTPVFTDGESADGGISVSFTDITEYVELENRYEREKMCIAILNIDNYDELISSTNRDDRAALESAIDKQIRFWGQKMQASVTKSEQNKYVLIFEHKAYEEQARSNFSILDDAREIETEADFPVTFSIGIGIGGDSPGQSDTYASDALAVALGRGGDQVVVKEENTISYFGGKTQTVEKGNKGKSRIIGVAMKRLIETASSVVIMGHKSPDMDSFGSALGVFRMAIPMNKNTYILVDEYNEALEALYSAAKQSGDYNLISSRNMKGMKREGMLVIVVDTHRPSMTECPELLDEADKVVVIDHHRKAEESIENPSLQYQEPYASSTAELITEILEYTIDRKQLTKLEVEALLAGI